MSSAHDQSAETGVGPPGIPGGAGVDPGVLGVIAELQGKLSALGKAHEEKLKRDEAALAERIKQTEAFEKHLAEERRRLEDDKAAMAQLREQLEADAAKLDEKRASVESQESQASELASAVERANKDLAEREARLKAAEAQAKERERKSQESTARAAAATAEAAKEAAARAQEAIAATERAEAAEAELERLRTQQDGAGRKLADEAKALRAQLDATGARAEQAEKKAAAAEADATALRERLAAAAKSASQASQAGDAALAARVAELDKTVTELNEQIAKRDHAIDLLRTKLAEAAAKASAQPAGGRSGESPSVTLRRVRLTRYRQLLQNEARKIVAAKNVLSKRQAECESVLAQRAKLVQHAQTLASREAKLGSRRSVVEATAAVCFAAGAVLLVAVLSWGAVSQIFPATYLATAVISAESPKGGREPDLAAWQQYHEQLVNDPRLMEEAAERMARRGIESLSKPPALAQRLKTDLMVTSDKPGMLRLELRGKGSERTARELETFATTLVAMANTGRENRADGAGSMQTQPAASGAEPVADDRLMYTGAFTAGGTGLAAIIGLIAWSQLSRAKRRFEASGIHEDLAGT